MPPKRFYAVAKGRRPGIYWSWQWAKPEVEGWGGNMYRKFDDYTWARQYMDQFGVQQDESEQDTENYDGYEDAYYGIDYYDHSSSGRIVEPWVDGCQPAYFTRDSRQYPMVFTDGCSLGNGQQTAKAGYGVFWGMDHPNNIAAPQRDGKPTNNRAELTAVIVAIQQAIIEGYEGVQICTDSKLVMNTACEWMAQWKLNGWRLANGKRVKNLDLVRELDGLLQNIDVYFRHVIAHQNSHNQLALGNKMADLLANEGAKMY